MISCIVLELYFLEASLLMHSFINFGQRSCPVLSGHNLCHLFASCVTLFIHAILYYAYYCITIPGRPTNTIFYNFLLFPAQDLCFHTLQCFFYLLFPHILSYFLLLDSMYHFQVQKMTHMQL